MKNRLHGDRSEVSASYDQWATSYDSDHNRTRDLAATVLRNSSLDFTNRDVLEVGCGTGRNTEWLDSNSRSVVAIDFSDGMLRQAGTRSLSQRVRLVKHDIRSTWPVSDDSADVVIAMLVLEHVETVQPVIAEAARALRIGGELFICELHPMRQMIGKQAEFTTTETGNPERITAFLHDVAEYVNAGISEGFTLLHLGEWRDANAQAGDLPRILSLHFKLDG
jgi:ubiquinone/menaquinone biosynthesis C-methylase UbiE